MWFMKSKNPAGFRSYSVPIPTSRRKCLDMLIKAWFNRQCHGFANLLKILLIQVTFLPPSFHDRDEICLSQVNRSAMYGMEIATR